MNYVIRLEDEAKEDAAEIILYLSQFYENTPLRFEAALKRELRLLAFSPGGARYEPKPEYRKCVFYNDYVMFYSVDENTKTVRIERIFHGSQDIQNII